MASICIMMTWTAVSVETWNNFTWSLSSLQCLELDLAWWLLCGLDWWCFAGIPKGGILCGQSITMWPYIITFKTPNVGVISCYVSLFLALKTVILIIWHHVDCRWWSGSGSQLLYSIKHFDIGYCITEHLWSLLIYVGDQNVGILQTLDEYSDCSCIICEVTPFSFCLEMMYDCCEELFFLTGGSPWIVRCMYEYQYCKASVIRDSLFHPKTYLKWWPLWLVCTSNPLILPWQALPCSHWWGLLLSQCLWASVQTR